MTLPDSPTSIDPVDVKPGMLFVGNYFSAQGKYGTPSANVAERLERRGYRVLCSSFRHNRLAVLFDKIRAIIHFRHEYEIALVDVFSGGAFVGAEAACWTLERLRKPCLLTLHGGNLPAFARRWPKRVRRLLRSARIVTSPSRYLQEQLNSYRNDIVVIPNAIEPSCFEFRARRNPAPRLVWLRAFHEIYNPSLAPKVVALLAKEFPQVHLTMFGPDKGDGSLRRCRETADELGVADRIAFERAVAKTEVSRRLNAGDVFINTTNADNTPVSVIEALACGLCVVSTNVGGLPWLLHHERDALLVPANDPNAMGAAVRRVLVEPELAARLSEGGRALAQCFCWNNVLPQWEQVIAAAAAPQDGGVS